MTDLTRMTRRIGTAVSAAKIAARSERALLSAKLSGRLPLLHHGLQRSGTNYLLLSLLRLGVPVINYRDPARVDPRHKHCRWQHDKTTLIDPISAQYGNALMVDDLDQLDTVCKVPLGTPHIVLVKRRDAWLKSICNWGLRCGWFTDERLALAQVNHLGRDYDAFVGFWADMEKRWPERAAVITYSVLAAGEKQFFDTLERLGFSVDPLMGALRIDSVPRSTVDRKELVTISDIEQVTTKSGSQVV